MRRDALLVLLSMLAQPALAQGFAGMGTEAEGFAVPAPDPVFDFPADHGPHPDYRIEWWYLTANLEGPEGQPYGLQWTLFRSALAPGESAGWDSPQVWFAHAAVTTPDDHYNTERFARGGIGQAGVQTDPFMARIDDWQMSGPTLDDLDLTATGPDFAYDMDLQAEGPLVFHGEGGYSVKSAQGQASYYYSQPFYRIDGELTLPGGVVPVTGSAWLDREWSSQPLAADQSGWDWFSLTFDSGAKLMAFQLRQRDGDTYSSGTWIAPDGTTTALADAAITAEPLTQTRVAGREVPTRWRLTLPARGLDVTAAALNPRAWMGVSVPYWEGPVTVTGSHDGVGYLEMTGYE
ncbi:lipocalin-like domain-containing protein [Salibaculum sp.]|uniref:lipocalin-like domain-containing protein n=1 Tax=Salibaculum sp. TaxID=2855480 RepID=UPI002B47BAD4|nr:lipocalin-like domain-containing protein [Salibaculum sp.]HKL70966.1 lipocalin-like domain-containing protein [Salibaculum sp.]